MEDWQPTDRTFSRAMRVIISIGEVGRVNTTEFKAFFLGQSGTPISTRVTAYNANTFLFGRGDLDRTDTYTQTDFAISYKYKFGRDRLCTKIQREGESSIVNRLKP